MRVSHDLTILAQHLITGGTYPIQIDDLYRDLSDK